MFVFFPIQEMALFNCLLLLLGIIAGSFYLNFELKKTLKTQNKHFFLIISKKCSLRGFQKIFDIVFATLTIDYIISIYAY